jgi:hypothetical protein
LEELFLPDKFFETRSLAQSKYPVLQLGFWWHGIFLLLPFGQTWHTLPTAEILKGKNTPTWVSIVFILKKKLNENKK